MNKRYCDRLCGSDKLNAGSNVIENAKNDALRKPSQELLQYYKNKATRLEKEFDNLSELLDNIKSACDLSTELHTELNLRNQEVARLQKIVSDLQIHLFREREHSLNLSAENDKLKIQAFEDRKKINALLLITGEPCSDMVHVLTGNSKNLFVERKLPPKLQKLKDKKMKVGTSNDNIQSDLNGCENVDPQILILKNHSLAAQLEHHICISQEQIEVLHKDRELAAEERQIERLRLQKQLDLITGKLKQTQDTLCETSSKLVRCQQTFEKEKNIWMEEKEKFLKTIKALKDQGVEKYPDVMGYSVSGVGSKKFRNCTEADFMKEQMLEKEQLAASYQEQVLAMEAEIVKLKDRAQTCRNIFKEKMNKMSAQTIYLRNKYEDLDRRRQLEAEGFRTDIRMLRERLKDLEKKLGKANSSNDIHHSEQQLLISARNTLNRARQLEKEIVNIKSKMSVMGAGDNFD